METLSFKRATKIPASVECCFFFHAGNAMTPTLQPRAGPARPELKDHMSVPALGRTASLSHNDTVQDSTFDWFRFSLTSLHGIGKWVQSVHALVLPRARQQPSPCFDHQSDDHELDEMAIGPGTWQTKTPLNK